LITLSILQLLAMNKEDKMFKVGQRVKFNADETFPRHKGIRGTILEVISYDGFGGQAVLLIKKDTNKRPQEWHASYWMPVRRSK